MKRKDNETFAEWVLRWPERLASPPKDPFRRNNSDRAIKNAIG